MAFTDLHEIRSMFQGFSEANDLEELLYRASKLKKTALEQQYHQRQRDASIPKTPFQTRDENREERANRERANTLLMSASLEGLRTVLWAVRSGRLGTMSAVRMSMVRGSV